MFITQKTLVSMYPRPVMSDPSKNLLFQAESEKKPQQNLPTNIANKSSVLVFQIFSNGVITLGLLKFQTNCE